MSRARSSASERSPRVVTITLMPFFTESPSEKPLTTETFITRGSTFDWP